MKVFIVLASALLLASFAYAAEESKEVVAFLDSLKKLGDACKLAGDSADAVSKGSKITDKAILEKVNTGFADFAKVMDEFTKKMDSVTEFLGQGIEHPAGGAPPKAEDVKAGKA